MFKDNMFLETSEKLANLSNLIEKTEVNNDILVSVIDIDNKISKEINRNKGRYITISYNKNKLSKNIEKLIETITNALNDTLNYLNLNKKSKILFVGLGNKNITTDTFGYKLIDKIVVDKNNYKIFKEVEGITNINSYEFIKVLASFLDVNVVIIFDSLSCFNIDRLGSTIQISTGGLFPGSAYSLKSNEISKKTIKKEVIVLGIPTIINMKNINIDNPNIVVSSNDIDLIIDDITTIISMSINRLF